MGTLYVVATPIGNLKDITLRALETLKTVAVVCAEDTRVTKKLFAHYGITTPLKRYDEHSHTRALKEIVAFLEEGKSVALTTDAGTPGIADPGARLVAAIRDTMPEVTVEPIPGASALVTALSVSGVSADRYTFLGYPPHKKGRETFFKELAVLAVRPVVLYESPHRLHKTFEALVKNLGANANIIVARELTKLYEELWRGDVGAAATHFTGERLRGEFVIIVL
ncbi:MAG: 16S rRNA (cytidine(1402)-2'-O)-methyltransferase [Candidatus Jorgensenbacteria bacterium]|nr:16S rRNA (cytidine(1402)-2'-O)-methyltransferase [Candidatus Jorgensenbacteria bacterium]